MNHGDQSARRWHEAAEKTVREYERKRAHAHARYAATGNPKYERQRWCLDQQLDEARAVEKRARRQLEADRASGGAA